MANSRVIGFLAWMAYAQAAILAPFACTAARAETGAPITNPGQSSSAISTTVTGPPSPEAAAQAEQPSIKVRKKRTPPEEQEIPQKPSAPPELKTRTTSDVFRCQRSFVYQGQVLECDSFVRQDAENLRPIIQDVPDAVSELNVYQHNRRVVRNAAYVGTLGLAIMAIALIVSHPPVDPNTGQLTGGGYAAIGGAAIAAGSFVYGLSLLRTNESHLNSAVTAYNTAHPESPIELRFSTGIVF